MASGWWRFTSSLKRTLISRRRRLAFEAERVERLALGVADHAGLAAAQVIAGLRAHRTVRTVRWILQAGPNRAARERPVGLPPFIPIFQVGRCADDRLALVARDVVGVHAGEEIVGVVVLAHVIEAEPPVFLLHRAPLGRTIGGAPRIPATAQADVAQLRGDRSADPDAVKKGEFLDMTKRKPWNVKAVPLLG